MRPEALNPLFAETAGLKGVGPQLAKPQSSVHRRCPQRLIFDRQRLEQLRCFNR